jgi:Tfp pilus assembly protein PilF
VERVNNDHESGYFLSIIFLQTVLSLTEKDSVASKRFMEKYISIEKGLSLSEADYTADFGWMYSMAGNQDRAEVFYRKALSLEPKNPVYLKKLADFLIDNNLKLNEVPDLMDNAMKLAQNRTNYYTYMDIKGWAFYKMGKNKEALEILQKVWDEAQYKIYTLRSHYEEVKKAVGSLN